MSKAKPLCPQTLRWASRRMRKHERGMNACQVEAMSRRGRSWEKDADYYMAKKHAYGKAAALLLLEAKRVERRRPQSEQKRR